MFYKRLKNERKRKGISQIELSKIVGVTQQAIAKWETNKAEPDNQTLTILASYFGVTTDYLLGRTDDRYSTVEKTEINDQSKPKDLQKFLDQQEIMFDGVPLTEDDKEKIRKALELIFWDAKQKNKRDKS